MSQSASSQRFVSLNLSHIQSGHILERNKVWSNKTLLQTIMMLALDTVALGNIGLPNAAKWPPEAERGGATNLPATKSQAL
ncbi:hypothetical protein GDO78_014248 [Eleutherodactylus coqui]|uniref:Uncharacterized protein n=1 Tax=Eleutherodactylus coqui TaxID=57060 RepID=A0A8J6E738_ELECQ|nr:hypothetical protein GDO78_014248 [Eleutherodactylus coqui]